MTLTGPAARPIRFTAALPAWRHVVETLGGALVHEAQGWLVYQLGSGRLALHAGGGDDGEVPGTTTFCVETPEPLDEAVRAVRDAGVPMEVAETNHGRAGVLRAADGTLVTLDAQTPADAGAPAAARAAGAAPGGASEPRLAVLPIWYGPDTSIPRDVLEALGARPEIVGDDGGWTELVFPGGGRAGVHRAESADVELAFWWDGDVEDALALLTGAGIDAVLIDETYSRTVQLADPDGGPAIWINERQTDLYGYTRAEG